MQAQKHQNGLQRKSREGENRYLARTLGANSFRSHTPRVGVVGLLGLPSVRTTFKLSFFSSCLPLRSVPFSRLFISLIRFATFSFNSLSSFFFSERPVVAPPSLSQRKVI